MRLTVLTCTGDRPEAFAVCERWMGRQTVKPFQWLVLDDGLTPTVCTQGQEYHYVPQYRGHGSMVNKVRHALENNLITGDALVWVEDDDWVAADWLAWCAAALTRYDLTGECENVYYNVRYRWWFAHANRGHASLCATACRRSVFPQLLDECKFSLDPFIDSRLWANCQLSKHAFPPSERRRSVGIKAMPGTKGYGSGHDRLNGWAQNDLELRTLRSLIGSDADVYAPFYEEPRKHRSIKQPDEMPLVEVHIVAYNEEMILPYTLRHYKTFASRIIVHDGGSTDRTLAICKEYGVEVLDRGTNGVIDDVKLTALKENCWRDTTADWVIVADADELLYFTAPVAQCLNGWDKVKMAIIKPRGFEMVSDTLPTTTGQIYEEIKTGGRDDRWYAKPILFSPRRVSEIHFSPGAHECWAMVNGTLRMENPMRFTEPAVHLLHYHHIGGVERIGKRYDENKSKFSDVQRKNGWGWHGDGLRHAKDKRAMIDKTLLKVIP